MLSVPDEVRCAVCKNIFCCLECRVRHEANAHSQNDVWNERNRMLCAFCKGAPAMEFRNRNDFALIMHLCQSHLPLHCKKCLTQFNSIGDFTVENKCLHVHDGCNLQTMPGKQNEICEKPAQSDNKEATNSNYITANCLVRKSFERSSIADSSVLSLKNYSTILHNSNNTLYKTQSPNSVAKALERQTSTPMHDNLVFKSPEPNGCSCSVSSGSSQMSSINSSSESETSPRPFTESTEARHDLHQESIVVTQKKTTTTIKRSKQSLAMTPLTRQVMTKSIHRAILEYQHAHNGPMMSPRSPLDLRTSFVVRRETGSPKKSPKPIENGHVGTKLATVMEHIKDSKDDENKENDGGVVSSGNDAKHNDTIDIDSCEAVPIKETPIAVSRKLSTEKLVSSSDGEIWFTPKEVTQPKVTDEIYTPKLSKKRQVQLNESIKMQKDTDDEEDFLSPDTEPKRETKKTAPSKLWSFVSTILRFASLTPTPDAIIDSKSSKEISSDSTAIIKRCASMADVLSEKASDEEMEPNNRLQPIKRRRIQSMHSSIEEQSVTTTTYRRIQCRRPIRSMQSSF